MKSVSAADGTTIYISVNRWSKYDKVPCLRAQAGFEPTFSDCESEALATRLSHWRYKKIPLPDKQYLLVEP